MISRMCSILGGVRGRRGRGLRTVRLVVLTVAASVGVNCAFCIENIIHPEALSHNTFCAQYLAEGKLTEAEARCKLSIEFSPKYAEPYNNLGLIEYSRKNLERAADYFKEAISYK